jgi:hypothetical protein
VIASVVPAGEFCNHKVNYLPEHKSRLPLRFVLGLLNSKLVDWYFRLGSTNVAVSHYQIYNLPCPLFAESSGRKDGKIEEATVSAVNEGKLELAFDLFQRLTKDAPFSPAIRGVIIEAVNCIVRIETDRGEIARVDRAQLAPAAEIQ